MGSNAESFKERLVEIYCHGSRTYRGLISKIDENQNTLTLCAVHQNGKNLPNSSALVINKDEIIDLKFVNALSLEELQSNTANSNNSYRTPRKNENKEPNDCFDNEDCDVNEEFDFAGNLQLFDKEAESREFDQQEYNASPRGGYRFKNNNNNNQQMRKKAPRKNISALATNFSRLNLPAGNNGSFDAPSQLVQPNNTSQIYRLPKEGYANFKYVFNQNGVEYAVPAVTPDFWMSLMSNLRDINYSDDRLSESVGALCLSPLRNFILSLPRNCESILLLAGPHCVGNFGLAIARYLSYSMPRVQITAYCGSVNRRRSVETIDVALLERGSRVRVVRDVKDLESSYDFVIDALDCETFEFLQILDWHLELQNWLKTFQVPTVAIQPPASQTRFCTFAIAILFPFQWNMPVLICNSLPFEAYQKKFGVQPSVDQVPCGPMYPVVPLHQKAKFEGFFANWVDFWP